MNTVQVTNWHQLKILVSLAQEYSEEDKQYDAPFAVYAVELVRRWQLPTYRFVLLYDESEPIGYTIMMTDETGLNNTLYVQDLYISKRHIGKQGFYALINEVYETAKKHNLARGEFSSKLDIDTWKKLTNLPVNSKTRIIVDNDMYKEER